MEQKEKGRMIRQISDKGTIKKYHDFWDGRVKIIWYRAIPFPSEMRLKEKLASQTRRILFEKVFLSIPVYKNVDNIYNNSFFKPVFELKSSEIDYKVWINIFSQVYVHAVGKEEKVFHLVEEINKGMDRIWSGEKGESVGEHLSKFMRAFEKEEYVKRKQKIKEG